MYNVDGINIIIIIIKYTSYGLFPLRINHYYCNIGLNYMFIFFQPYINWLFIKIYDIKLNTLMLICCQYVVGLHDFNKYINHTGNGYYYY